VTGRDPVRDRLAGTESAGVHLAGDRGDVRDPRGCDSSRDQVSASRLDRVYRHRDLGVVRCWLKARG